MKSLKLIAVAAIFGAFMTSCEAESLTEDEQQVEIISSTENQEVDTQSSEDDD